jgi:hypothetical protein
MSEEVPKNATKCVGNRSMNAEFWWGTYRGTAAKNHFILFVFNVTESLGGNQRRDWMKNSAVRVPATSSCRPPSEAKLASKLRPRGGAGSSLRTCRGRLISGDDPGGPNWIGKRWPTMGYLAICHRPIQDLPAARSGSSIASPGPTPHAPTARPNASSKPPCASGPTPAPIRTQTNAAKSYPLGCTSTTGTDLMLVSGCRHHQPVRTRGRQPVDTPQTVSATALGPSAKDAASKVIVWCPARALRRAIRMSEPP